MTEIKKSNRHIVYEGGKTSLKISFQRKNQGKIYFKWTGEEKQKLQAQKNVQKSEDKMKQHGGRTNGEEPMQQSPQTGEMVCMEKLFNC